MARLVKKFGGTSLASPARFRDAAERVRQAHAAGDQVLVVTSAMAGETDRLAAMCAEAELAADSPEYDLVLATGEQVAAGLMAAYLKGLGVPARSFTGWQVPIQTDKIHGQARIQDIETNALESCLAAGQVCVVTGFQGLSPDQRVATLGRGGSDLTAVSIAAALHADRCDIYTDVNGVYTADPRLVPKARKLDKITFEEMLEMAWVGAKVLQARSVLVAMRHGVVLQVRSSFNDAPGTFVTAEEVGMEGGIVSSITCSRDEARITIRGLRDIPGVAAAVFLPLAAAEINVDMIVQSAAPDGKSANLTFTVAKADMDKSIAILKENQEATGFSRLLTDSDLVKVSVVGQGMASHAGVAETMFRTLGQHGINIQVISTSEIKISVLIPQDYAELALRALHTAYGLDTVGDDT